MRFLVQPLLAEDDAAQVLAHLQAAEHEWEQGALTAGAYAKAAKTNWQLDRDTALFEQLEAVVRTAVLGHPLIRSAALPLLVHSILFSRAGIGEGYGRHVDNPFMGGGRTDLSFTLFLSDPAGYEGGELIVERPDGEDRYKLPAGHALVYPSSSLHRVEPVSAGMRYVAAGWMQSVVRDHGQRELLFELETACRSLAQRLGRCDELDLLYRCQANLLRRWGQ